jgi:hypothetical protein
MQRFQYHLINLTRQEIRCFQLYFVRHPYYSVIYMQSFLGSFNQSTFQAGCSLTLAISAHMRRKHGDELRVGPALGAYGVHLPKT